ncbi:MAG: hypothetical protein KC656_23830, partial [Myxococcales bacterium]|nr:hypothetical protein [Myxococcales bacterium]
PEGTLLAQTCRTQVEFQGRIACTLTDAHDIGQSSTMTCLTEDELAACGPALPTQCDPPDLVPTQADMCCLASVSTRVDLVGPKRMTLTQELADLGCEAGVERATGDCCAFGEATDIVIPEDSCPETRPTPAFGEATLAIDAGASHVTLSAAGFDALTLHPTGAITGSGWDGGAKHGGFRLDDIHLGP